jgi:hypothetical protein
LRTKGAEDIFENIREFGLHNHIESIFLMNAPEVTDSEAREWLN